MTVVVAAHLEDSGGGIYEDGVDGIYDDNATPLIGATTFSCICGACGGLLLQAWLPPRPVVACSKLGGAVASTFIAWSVVVVVVARLFQGRGGSG
jgi:hypothetical protein